MVYQNEAIKLYVWYMKQNDPKKNVYFQSWNHSWKVEAGWVMYIGADIMSEASKISDIAYDLDVVALLTVTSN